jgi:hypothetical protein
MFGENPLLTRGYRLLGILGIVALALSVVGGSNATSTKPSEMSQSNTYRHVGSILFVVLYALLIAAHVGCWCCASRLMKYSRTVCHSHSCLSLQYVDAICPQLLIAISSALPFLGIRVLYSVLSSYSGSPVPNIEPSTNSSLSKFNISNGDWRIYLAMGLIMEYIVVLVYTTAGARIPLQDDHSDGKDIPSQMEHIPLGRAERPHNHWEAVYPLQA